LVERRTVVGEMPDSHP